MFKRIIRYIKIRIQIRKIKKEMKTPKAFIY